LPASRGYRLLRFVLRASAGIVVIALLLARTNLGELVDVVRRANVPLLILGTITFFASLLLSSLRWRAFLRPLGIGLDGVFLVRLYLVGTFFNAFLPTGFGGDAYKAFVLGRDAHSSSIEEALAAAALDRLAGLLGIAVLSLIGGSVQLMSRDATAVTLVSVILAGLLFVAVSAALAHRSDPATRVSDAARSGLRARMRTFFGALAIGARHPGALREGASWGAITALLLVAAHGLLLAAVHTSVPDNGLAGIVLIASLTTAIPLSINGLGFREATYVWALSAYGEPSDAALAFALIMLVVTLLTSAVGGVVYALGGSSLPRSLEDVEDRRYD
jgi:uncharacterized membrane protein YbhN (UPF0104 family)